MKDEDIKLPDMKFLGTLEGKTWRDDIQEYARQAVRMNLEGDTSIIQQARAWELVHNALSIVRPGWQQSCDTGQDAAVKTILDLGAKAAVAQPKPSDPEPFDLARAMAGEPIVTRDGRKAKFVGYVPEFSPERQIAVAIDGASGFDEYYKDGRYFHDAGPNDLFMAPKPKRTVWVNVWGVKNCQNFATSAHESKERATEVAADNFGCKYLAIAHPIEIDA